MALRICAVVVLLLSMPNWAKSADFSDDFQNGTLDSWVCDPCADWSVTCANSEGTALVIQPFLPSLLSTLCVGSLEWGDFQLDVDLRGLIPTDKMVRFRYAMATGEYYYVNFRSRPENDLWLSRFIPADGSSTTLATVPLPHEIGQWHHLTIRAEGGHFRVWIDNVLQIDANDPSPIPQGTVCLGGWTGAAGGCGVQWDNVAVIDLVVPSEAATWGQVKTRWK